MNTSAIFGTFCGDLLTEVDLKPWWEKLRGYCMAMIVGCTFIISQISTIFFKIDCLPVNLTSGVEFSRANAIFINNVCSNQLPKLLRNFKVLEVITSTLLVIGSSWWSLLPGVVNSFRSYRRVEDLLDELLLTTEELDNEEAIEEAVKDKKQRTNLEKIRSLAKEIENKKYVSALYQIRNFVLLFFTACCLLVFYYSWKRCDANFSFRCQLNSDTIEDFDGVLVSLGGIKNYSCSHDLARKLPPFHIVVIAFAAMHGFLVMVGIFQACCSYRKQRGKSLWKEGRFIEMFWKNSRPVGKGHFGECAELLLSEKSSKLTLFYLHYKRNPEVFLKRLESYAETNDGMLNHKELVEYVDDFLLDKDHAEEASLALAKLAKARHWEVFMSLLERLEDLQKSDMQILKSINLQEIGYPYEKERSVLYYALRTSTQQPKLRLQAALHLLKHTEDQRAKFVYYDGKHMKARKFFQPEVENHKQGKKVLQMLVNEKKRAGSFTGRHLALRDLGWLEHCASSEEIPEKNDLTKIAEKLSYIRFVKWSEDMKSTAKDLADKKYWMIFIELLNSYAGETSQNQNCGITNFVVNNKNDATPPFGSLLFYALRKSSYRASYAHRASEYILQHTRNQEEKKVWNEQGKVYTAREFIDRNEELSYETKEMLKRFLDGSKNHDPSSSSRFATCSLSDECETLLPF